MPVETVGFHLKPVGFFKHNPALDLPRTVNTASKLISSCCGAANGHVRPSLN
jgi:primary-amine oxidase